MNLQNILSQGFDLIVPFVLLLGILVFVHELGHFLVARLCGVRVEVFSIGFGKKLLSYKRGDTVYCLSLIPLGGYVKMFGEQGTTLEFSEEEKKVSFTHKTVWQRIAIVLAGPLMNFFFAILVFGFISMKGEEARTARIPEVEQGSAADKAGLKSQDKVLKVNGESIVTFDEFQKKLNQFQNKTIELVVAQDNQQERTISVAVSEISNPNIFTAEKTIGSVQGILPFTRGTFIAVKYDSYAYRIGLRTGDEIVKIDGKKIVNWNELSALISSHPLQVEIKRGHSQDEPDQNSQSKTIQSLLESSLNILSLEDFGIESPDLYLDQVVAGSPAELAGLQRFDKILDIDSQKIKAWGDVLLKIKSYSGSEALMMTVLRDGAEVSKKLTPKMTSQMTMQGKEERRYTVGIMSMMNVAMPETVIISEKNPVVALYHGLERSWNVSVMTVMSFVRMIQGEVSHKNIGGMISIGKVAKDSFKMGVNQFLMTMGILSISLFILNLLPVPVLDGGHLVFYIVEVIKGSPLSLKKIEIAHQVGFALLMGLMALALFNDFTKYLF